MGIRLHHTLSFGLLASALLIALGVPAAAASKSGDVQIARAATFVLADFPAGFAATSSTPSSSAENIKLAKGVPGCAPYITLQKLTGAQPQATSTDFADDSRTISNEVDVFKTERAANDALALFAKPSMVSCLQQLFKKQLAQDPKTKGKIDSVSITLDRQDIAGLGDDSVVYEGNMTITGTDSSTTQVGIGNAAVRVGRAVDDVTYLTTSAPLTDVVSPAIDASVARLRAALAGSAATS
jgi:molybdopterin-binding protein